MSTRLSIAGVSERDIDLMLLEEFLSSPSFLDWFVLKALGPGVSLGRCIAAKRSVTHSIGESDLEVLLEGRGDGRIRLMIENKVNARLQPLQAQRYVERGKEYVARGQCSAFHTVLVAPSGYFGTSKESKGFGTRVTYEQLLIWFEGAAELGERGHYKKTLLKSAIEKGSRGTQMEEDAPNTEFWHSYWRLATERAPELEMREPGPKPSRSGFIHFHPNGLPPGVDLFHKFNFGYVDIQLRGKGNRVNEIRRVFSPHFEKRMNVEPAAQSAAIRCAVPKMKAGIGMAQQVQAACEGIDTAKQMLAWFLSHKELWMRHVKKGGLA